ncbi:unnamed protein product [Symbiodinium microadriaticum]|nr:unnamed protein product [Symbiodinium microadriaticum]
MAALEHNLLVGSIKTDLPVKFDDVRQLPWQFLARLCKSVLYLNYLRNESDDLPLVRSPVVGQKASKLRGNLGKTAYLLRMTNGIDLADRRVLSLMILEAFWPETANWTELVTPGQVEVECSLPVGETTIPDFTAVIERLRELFDGVGESKPESGYSRRTASDDKDNAGDNVSLVGHRARIREAEAVARAFMALPPEQFRTNVTKPKIDPKVTLLNSGMKRARSLIRKRIGQNWSPLVNPLNPTGTGIEFEDFWASRLNDALTRSEIRHCVSHLIPELKDECLYRRTGAAVILLGMVSSRQFHELIAALTGNIVTAGQSELLRFELSATGTSFLICSPQQHRVAKEGQSDEEEEDEIQFLEGSWRLAIPQEIGPILWEWEHFLNSAGSVDQYPDPDRRKFWLNHQNFRLMSWISAHRATLRNQPNCSRYGESMCRQTIVCDMFEKTFDIPLVQLATARSIGLRQAALNYLSVESSLLESLWLKSARDLFDQQLTFHEGPKSEGYIGTPRARSVMEEIQALAKAVESIAIVGRRGSLERLVSEYNKALLITGIMFLVGTSHRNQKISRVKAKHISLQAGLAIIADKMTGPSKYRRVVAVSHPLKYRLHHLYSWLIRIFENDEFRKAVSPEHLKKIELAIRGEGPLFLDLKLHSNKVTVSNWNSGKAISDLTDGRFPASGYRHFLSSLARKKRWPALLVETQLGHGFGLPMFDENCAIAPLEFSRAMDPYLTEMLTEAGFNTDVPKQATTFQWLDDVEGLKLSSDLAAFERQQLDLDKVEFEKQANSPGKPETQYELLNAASRILRPREIELHSDDPEVEADTDNKIELRIQLEQFSEAKAYLHNHCGGDFRLMDRVLGSLRGRLRMQKIHHDWNIEWPSHYFWSVGAPIEITYASLGAFDRMDLLREELLRVNRQSPKLDPLGNFCLHLILFADVRKTERLVDILENVTRAMPMDGVDTLLVPLPVRRETGPEYDDGGDDDSPSPSLDEVKGLGIRSKKQTMVGDEAFPLGGTALAALVPLLKSGLPEILSMRRLESSINDVLDLTEFKQPKRRGVLDRLISLASLSDRIELPDILRNVSSERITTRQLAPDRMAEFIKARDETNTEIDSRSININWPAFRDPVQDPAGVKAPQENKDKSQVDVILGVFKSIVRNADAVAEKHNLTLMASKNNLTGHRRMQVVLDAYIETIPITSLTILLKNHLMALLEPDANLKNPSKPAEYRKSSLDNFVTWMAPGIHLFADSGGLENYDPDDFAEQFEALFALNPDSHREAEHIMRFFTSSDLPVPPLHHMTVRKTSAADIDAGFVSDREYKKAVELISSGWPGASQAAMNAQGWSLGLAHLDVTRATGARAGEVASLRFSELFKKVRKLVFEAVTATDKFRMHYFRHSMASGRLHDEFCSDDLTARLIAVEAFKGRMDLKRDQVQLYLQHLKAEQMSAPWNLMNARDVDDLLKSEEGSMSSSAWKTLVGYRRDMRSGLLRSWIMAVEELDEPDVAEIVQQLSDLSQSASWQTNYEERGLRIIAPALDDTNQLIETLNLVPDIGIEVAGKSSIRPDLILHSGKGGQDSRQALKALLFSARLARSITRGV